MTFEKYCNTLRICIAPWSWHCKLIISFHHRYSDVSYQMRGVQHCIPPLMPLQYVRFMVGLFVGKQRKTWEVGAEICSSVVGVAMRGESLISIKSIEGRNTLNVRRFRAAYCKGCSIALCYGKYQLKLPSNS